MDRENQKTICRMYLNGIAQTDIADALDISISSVIKVTSDCGIEISPCKHPHRLRYVQSKRPKQETIVIGGKKYKDVTYHFI